MTAWRVLLLVVPRLVVYEVLLVLRRLAGAQRKHQKPADTPLISTRISPVVVFSRCKLNDEIVPASIRIPVTVGVCRLSGSDLCTQKPGERVAPLPFVGLSHSRFKTALIRLIFPCPLTCPNIRQCHRHLRRSGAIGRRSSRDCERKHLLLPRYTCRRPCT